MKSFCTTDEIRSLFSQAMSDMYRTEVPQYGTLIDLVRDVNAETLAADPALHARLAAAGELDRLDCERHGAIRLGTAEELSLVRRMFAVMGMLPVGYYDLSVAGIPVHSTAFRPVEDAALKKNPFRVFTSLLRLDLVEDRDLAAKAEHILSLREIVTADARALIELAETQGGLTEGQAHKFVREALETFRWHSEATVCTKTYGALVAAHRLIADVVSFKGPHINHLTPRTLDIDAVQAQMPARGITPKAVIEGPPRRKADILLRQTSFKALEEEVLFQGHTGSHTARFGEIEQRGVALTPAGRALYDRTLTAVRAEASRDPSSNYETVLGAAFETFPDDLDSLRRKDLAFFQYRVTGPANYKAETVDDLIAAGAMAADPQVYEDFLPVSAAGIFQSNLGADDQSNYSANANQAAFEEALGATVIDEMALYAEIEETSRMAALSALGQDHLIKKRLVA
ncbi:VOC family protein [Marinovum sp. 2_MG-2023]|uniref:2-oxoadipate dioxygenase/decarboxylase HglS n=1 Tax=unclassified Marinovum TaxID=2647166 RepID=UPI0026E14B60|nr:MULTISPECIES: VOC family protein [unclassified Marinovum]MDO6729230.1 VOC family protein [Marinovum sp. 2_MG-2023]MDO6779143.1 VOC family protein [Marinovum sp. 1_MG-2023]